MQCQKTFSVNIAGFSITSPSVLPDQTGWEFYTYQLTAAGGTPPYTFALIAGSITGGSVDAAGLIDSEFHNVNLIPVTSNFTIRCTDAALNTVDKAFSLTCVDAQDCPSWGSISWPDGTPFFTPSLGTGASFTGSCNAVAGGIHIGTLAATLYSEGCTTSELQWTWNVDAAGGSAQAKIDSSLTGTLVNRSKVAGSSGSETIRFGVQPGTHTFTIRLVINSGGGATSISGSIVNT